MHTSRTFSCTSAVSMLTAPYSFSITAIFISLCERDTRADENILQNPCFLTKCVCAAIIDKFDVPDRMTSAHSPRNGLEYQQLLKGTCMTRSQCLYQASTGTLRLNESVSSVAEIHHAQKSLTRDSSSQVKFHQLLLIGLDVDRLRMK